MKLRIYNIESRLANKPIGYLTDVAIKLYRVKDSLGTVKELTDTFGFYSKDAQRSVLIGTIKRRLNGNDNKTYAADKILLR